MLYIHKLSDLNTKSADIESLQFVRSIRQNVSFPVTEQKLNEYLADLFVSDADLQLMQRSLSLLSPTVEKLSEILQRNDASNEPVNIHRSIQGLSSLAAHLEANLAYAGQVVALQQEFMANVVPLLNSIPYLKTSEEKSAANAVISGYFECLLRSKGMSFDYRDVVCEAQTILISDLVESFRNGYIFHFTLEDELRKAAFNDIRLRIPLDSLREHDEVAATIRLIKEGIDRAYSLNMRMISWAIVFLSFIKCATSR